MTARLPFRKPARMPARQWCPGASAINDFRDTVVRLRHLLASAARSEVCWNKAKPGVNPRMLAKDVEGVKMPEILGDSALIRRLPRKIANVNVEGSTPLHPLPLDSPDIAPSNVRAYYVGL
jgi:hypothetical protein